MVVRNLRLGIFLSVLIALLAACAPMETITITPGTLNPPNTQQPIPSAEPSTAAPTEAPSPVPSGDLPTYEVASANLQRDRNPDVPNEDLETLVAGNTAFNFALYDRLNDTADNLIYSPYSISLALAMVHAGAGGATEQQIAEAMQFLLPQDLLHPAFNALALLLEPEELPDNYPGEPFQLSIVNAVWGQSGYPFRDAFLDTLALNYGAGLHMLDFLAEPDPSRQVINRWVEEQTEDRIRDLLPPGSVTSDTRMVLTNAIYFYGAWLHPFDEANTSEGEFFLLDGTTTTASMMQQTEQLGYLRGVNFQVVVLPYIGGDIAMAVIMPDEGQFADFESNLNSDVFREIAADSDFREIRLSLPKFEYTSEYSLVPAMQELGMIDPFDPSRADFSGIADTPDSLFISGIVHKAFVKVDESGTEAAAATGVVVGITSAPAEPLVVRIDHPFFFVIFDRDTGTILFMGRVLDPS
nr:serpin family protein [Anaerolineae bacterium]